MENKPKITVITVCYNCVSTIDQTIRSVVEQTYDNIEYIIIDGASTDGTLDVIKKYENRIARIVSEPDKGIYDAMNKGIALASGEWIHFRNSGDYFLSKHTVEDVFNRDYSNEVGVIHGDCYYVYPEYYVRRQPAMLSRSYKEDMPVLHPATFVRAQLQKECPFDLNYRSAADYNFFYGLCETDVKFLYIPVVVATFATGGFSSNWERAFFEDRRIQGRFDGVVGKTKVYFEYIKIRLWKRFKAPKMAQKSTEQKIQGAVVYDY